LVFRPHFGQLICLKWFSDLIWGNFLNEVGKKTSQANDFSVQIVKA